VEYRRLGRTGLDVSRVSLGTGGPSRLGQRTHGDTQRSLAVIARALDRGINLFDTAAVYGDSELLLGRALAGVPRDRYLLATKFIPRNEEAGETISGDQLIASCERSLERLRVDTLDILQFHGVLPDEYAEVVDRLLPVAKRLQEAGKVRFLGISEQFLKDPSHRMLESALDDDCWDTLMVKYGILNQRAARAVLPRARDQDVGVFNMSALRVKLTRPGELERTLDRWKQAGLIDHDALPDTDPLGFLVHNDVGSVLEAAYKFGAAPEAISTIIVGTGNPDHLDQNTDTILSGPLGADDHQRLVELFGHIVESEADTG